MRAPDNIASVWTRSDDEIIAEIIDVFDYIDDLDRSMFKLATVGGAIDTLRVFSSMKAPIWGNRRDNLDSIKTVANQIARLQRLLQRMPKPALALLFAFEETGLGNHIPSTTTQQKTLARCRTTVGMLAWLRTRCDRLLADPPGKHGNADYLQELTAEAAWDILIDRGKRPAAVGSEKSLYRKVTSLLWEVVTGEPGGASLEHPCRVVFESRAAGETDPEI